ncbi:MAG TPA: hypothetical protein VMW19_18090 [Myxococcota bacterium]|nr:hypothetical protein [Myxococcota bacterium]
MLDPHRLVLEGADLALATVIDRRERGGAAVARERDLVADRGAPAVRSELLDQRGRARATEAQVGLDGDVAESRYRAQQGARGLRFALSRLA